MSESPVLITQQDSVAVVTLNLPRERNVLSAELVSALTSAYEAVENDSAVRCVVLTGAGPAFCAGAHLSTLESAASNDFESVRSVYEGFLRVLASPLPTIGAINGPAVGAGFNLALACDIRLAGPKARFDTRFAALQLHPGGGHTWLLTRTVGAQQAMLACLFGEVWDAETARDRGLVATVHDADALVPAAVELGSRLAGHSGEFVRRLVATLRFASSGAGHEPVLAAESTAQEWSLHQPEFLTGLERIRTQIQAAAAKRSAN
jgi:enoyl-CoA hydratase